jgi:hypothetical protein
MLSNDYSRRKSKVPEQVGLIFAERGKKIDGSGDGAGMRGRGRRDSENILRS